MSGEKFEVALKTVNDVVFSQSAEQSQNVYDDWSKSYDKHMEILGSSYAPEAGKMFEEFGKNCEIMLDIGGGTGSVIEHIREVAGYDGVVDILDANLPMLAKAESKGLNIRNIVRHFIKDDGILPVKDQSYDVITSAGCFIPNHIPASALKGILNAVKVNGYAIVTTRSRSTEGYKVEFDKIIEDLRESGKVKVVQTKEFRHFPKSNQDTMSMVYVLKRLS